MKSRLNDLKKRVERLEKELPMNHDDDISSLLSKEQIEQLEKVEMRRAEIRSQSEESEKN